MRKRSRPGLVAERRGVTAGIHALVVSPVGKGERGFCVPVVVADERPAEALSLRDPADPRDLALTVVRGIHSGRGEHPRMPHLVSGNEMLREATMPIDGPSARLPLALAVIGDLYGLSPRSAVYATGQVDPLDGSVGPVALVASKLAAILRRVNGTEVGNARALVLLPTALRLAAEDQEAEEHAREAIAQLEARGVRVRRVASTAEAAKLAFGEEFGALAIELGELRAELRDGIYDASRHAELVAKAEQLCARLDDIDDSAMEAAAVGGPDSPGSLVGAVMRVEALAIASWAASRLSGHVRCRGAQLPAQEVAQRFATEGKALQARSGVRLWPETRALVENLAAATHLGRSLNFLRGERLASDALAIPGVVAGPIGEHRKLLGTRSQLRCCLGLRALARDDDAEAREHFDDAVRDIRRAFELARHPEVKAVNDRARVAVYLATALLCRDGPGDVDEARSMLERDLGIEDGAVTGPAAQSPGWAFAVLAWLLVREQPGGLTERWSTWASEVQFEGHTLADAMEAELPYREVIAATLALDAHRVGRRDLAAHWTQFARQEPNLRSLARWWPLLGLEATATPALTPYRRTAATGFRRGIHRPDGPCTGRWVSRLLVQLGSSDREESMDAWRALTLWTGQPTPPNGAP